MSGLVDGARVSLLHAREGFEERAFEGSHERNVETVLPDNRLPGLIAVVVPRPARREYQVSRVHHGLLAFDGCVGSAPLHDEAERRL